MDKHAKINAEDPLWFPREDSNITAARLLMVTDSGILPCGSMHDEIGKLSNSSVRYPTAATMAGGVSDPVRSLGGRRPHGHG